MHSSPIDLRSDTVTRPTPEMRKAIANAEVGDEVLGDDPTVRRLEEKFAALLGKPAACFVPTGTMANQTAIRAHTEPGDEIICSEGAHIIHYETGAPAALSGVMIRTIPGPKGLFDVQDVAPLIRQDAYHFPHSRLVMMENTHNRGGGTVWPLAQVQRVAQEARRHGLKLHLDGARLWNAHVATGVAMKDYAAPFDTISCCFSKGLGAPVGSAVAGDATAIMRVQRFKKMFGGMTRQVGILAAAALYAMENHIARLAEDHANAKKLAEMIANIPGLSIALGPVETNILYFDIAQDVPLTAQELSDRLKSMNVLMLATGPRRIRCVTHLDVHASMIPAAAQAIERCVTGRTAGRTHAGV
ncbi:MAG: GntG family PLP-dependent aldolase [Phycisphaerales bacterium]|nr:aminotransferase class I/II-fold pyridoxal phosphate-dependent enzyme [Planctomycetota bacterium]